MTYDRDKWEADLRSVVAECRGLLSRKQNDYGPDNIAKAPGGPLNGLRVRMFDKLARINNLIESGSEPSNESLEDSFMDLANYSIIGLMVLRGLWPGAEAKDEGVKGNDEGPQPPATIQKHLLGSSYVDEYRAPFPWERGCDCSAQGPCWDHR